MTMQPLRPILTRDLRNQRWLLLAWIAVLLASVASRVIGPHLSVESATQDLTMRSLGSLAFAHLVLVILGVALIVQTDVVVGTTAFWLTRPIARTTMLRAKLVSSFVIIVLPALVIEAILMAAYGMSPITIVLALLQQAGFMFVCVLPIALGAAATRTLPQMFLLIAAALVTWMLWIWLDSQIWGSPKAPAPAHPLRSHDPSAGIIVGVLISAGLLVALAFQYVRRQAALALLIGCVAIIAATEGRGLWTHVSLFGGEPKPPREAWTTAPLILPSGERLTWPALRQAARIVADNVDQRKRIAAPLTIEGLPSNYTVEPFTTEATLRFANDTISSAPAGYRTADGYDWTVIINARNDSLRAAGNEPAAYHAEFDLGLTRRDRLATVPLAPGAGVNDGARRLVVRSFNPLSGPVPRCLIEFDQIRVELLTQWRRSPQLDIGVRLADGTPAHSVLGTTLVNSFAEVPFEALPQGFHPFQIISGEVEVYAPRCEGLLLDIDRVSYAGRLLRTVDLPAVNLNEVIAMESR